MDKFDTDAPDPIKRAEFQEAVKQALIRLLDDPQIKKKLSDLIAPKRIAP